MAREWLKVPGAAKKLVLYSQGVGHARQQMNVIGEVESLWRYPVKSMRGELLQQAFFGFAGVYGDRVWAFISSAAPVDFSYLTGRQKQEMLLYRPVYRNPEAAHLMVDVETPTGEVLAIDNPALLDLLREGLRENHELSLRHSHQAMTDCRPISLLSTATVKQLSAEVGTELDKRRFRMNLYVDLESSVGFGEDEFVGRTLRIGGQVVVTVIERDPRCKMITLDPETGAANPEVMRRLARAHAGKAGVYGAVLVEGTVSPGDKITLLD